LECWEPSQHLLLGTGKPRKTCVEVAGRRTFRILTSSQQSVKTILELVLWNGLQSCHCITPDVINVVKMPSFQYFLYWGLDPVNRQGVPT